MSYRRFVFGTLILATVFAIGGDVQAQSVAPPKEPAPDWLAWRLFQETMEFNNQQALMKANLKTSPPSSGPLKAPAPLNAFEQAMKRQFGMSPAHTAELLASGKTYLTELQTIYDNAKGEVNRRYKTPAALAAQARGPQKTTMQRAKEDGLHAQVEGQRESALAAHLRSLSRVLSPEELTKITQFVRTSVAPGITLTTPDMTFKNRGLPPGIARPLPNGEKR